MNDGFICAARGELPLNVNVNIKVKSFLKISFKNKSHISLVINFYDEIKHPRDYLSKVINIIVVLKHVSDLTDVGGNFNKDTDLLFDL